MFPTRNTDEECSSYLIGIVLFFLGVALLGLILKNFPS